MAQKWVFPLDPQFIASGAAYASSTTLTDVSPLPNKTIPANFLLPGMRIKVRAAVSFSTTATPTLLSGVYYGGVAGTALAATSAVTTGTATGWALTLWYEGTVRTIGASGTIMGYGFVDLGTSLTAYSHRPIPETALATVTIDTTTAKAITLGAQWGTNSASNTLTCVDFAAEISG